MGRWQWQSGRPYGVLVTGEYGLSTIKTSQVNKTATTTDCLTTRRLASRLLPDWRTPTNKLITEHSEHTNYKASESNSVNSRLSVSHFTARCANRDPRGPAWLLLCLSASPDTRHQPRRPSPSPAASAPAPESRAAASCRGAELPPSLQPPGSRRPASRRAAPRRRRPPAPTVPHSHAAPCRLLPVAPASSGAYFPGPRLLA